MSALLNMYTTTIKRLSPGLLLVLVLLFAAANSLVAQDCYVQPITPTSLYVTQTELHAYLSGGSSKNTNLWTANNYVHNSNNDLHGRYFEAGLATSVYTTRHDWIRFNGAIGYKHQIYSYDKLSSSNSGVYTHWMTADANAAFVFQFIGACVGVKSDILLSSRIKNADHFSYEGLYRDCFNPASLCAYTGLMLRLHRFKIEARIGGYILPQLNPQKISYYNITKTYVNGFYYEIKAYYCFFTTGKVKRDL